MIWSATAYSEGPAVSAWAERDTRWREKLWRHEGSSGVAPPYLTSAIDGGEWPPVTTRNIEIGCWQKCIFKIALNISASATTVGARRDDTARRRWRSGLLGAVKWRGVGAQLLGNCVDKVDGTCWGGQKTLDQTWRYINDSLRAYRLKIPAAKNRALHHTLPRSTNQLYKFNARTGTRRVGTAHGLHRLRVSRINLRSYQRLHTWLFDNIM